MATNPTYLQIDATVSARAAEVPAASFANGMNVGGSNAPGIGINMGVADLVGEPQQFTLLDQGRPVESGQQATPVARDPQISQQIGGNALGAGVPGVEPSPSVRHGTLPTQAAKDADPALDGTIIAVANTDLLVLATGWADAA